MTDTQNGLPAAPNAAHQLNNHLAVIIGFCELLLHADPGEDRRQHAIEEIKRAAKRAVALTGELRDVRPKWTPQPERIALNDVVSDSCRLVHGLIGRRTDILLELSPDSGHIHADRDEIEQAIVSLVLHLQQWAPPGGKILIKTERRDLAYAISSWSAGASRCYAVVVASHNGGQDVGAVASAAESAALGTVPKNLNFAPAASDELLKWNGGLIWWRGVRQESKLELFLPSAC